jgi:pimeloyl-ACP methyl ester carboxylesterase
MKRAFISLLSVAAFAYAALCVALFALQDSLIYFPQPRAINAPQTTMLLPVEGASIFVTTRPRVGPRAIIYFGGNAEDVSLNLPSFERAFPNHALYLLHYRGYGGSSGSPSEESIQRDALALFDKVHGEHADITIVGRSLGSGVAVRLSSQRPASHLILITPYDSLAGIAAERFPYVPVRWLLRDTYDSLKYAPTITAPTSIIAAEHDETIPRVSTDKLFARFSKGVASIKVIPATGHNTISSSGEYLAEIQAALYNQSFP